jgi:NAD(P)-dependent dehydrogenase (short-subunit alcohol dehydrogenase family)
MQTNYLGPYLLTQRLLPLLIASGTPSKPSRIVFVSSESHYTCPTFAFEDINNLESLPFNSLQYVISKFLCTVQTMALADQLKDQNVVVHAVCPGLTITEFWDNFPDSQKAFAQFLQRFSIGNSVPEAASNVILGNCGCQFCVDLVISSQEAERCTGGYWANMDKVPPCPKVLDKKLQKDIVEKTNLLLNL